MAQSMEVMSIPANPTGPEMIAILDRTTETRVGTVGGPITPGFDPIFKDSENGELSLDFFVPAKSEDADKIVKGNLALVRDPFVPSEWRLFEIDEIDFEKDNEGNAYKRAVCQDQMMVELDDDWIHTLQIENSNATDALSLLLRTGESRWKVGNVSLNTTGSATIDKKSAAAGLSDLLVEWGGILRSRVEIAGGKITGRYIDWYSEDAWENFTGVRFENGKNLIGMKKTIVRRYVKTKVFPYGKKIDVNTVYWIVVQRTASKSTANATVAALKAKGFKEAKVLEENDEYVAVARIYKMKAWAEKEVYMVRNAGWSDATVEEKQLDGTGSIDPNASTEDGEYVTIKDVVRSRDKGDPYDKPEGEEFIADPEALLIWGRPDPDTGLPRHKVEQVDFPEIEDPEELYEAGAAWLQEHNHELVTFDAEVLDRSMEPGRSHESIRLGTAGYVIDDDFSPPIEVRARVIALEVNLNDRSDVKVTLGNFAPSQIAASNAVEAELQKKVDQGAPITLLDTTIQTTRDRFRSSLGYKYESPTLGTVWSNGVYGDPDTNGYVGIKGGMITVADEWDPVAGEPAWRTAITGKGVSADVITGGTLNAGLVNIETTDEDGTSLVRLRDGYLYSYDNDEINLALGGRGLWLYSPDGWKDPALGHNFLAKVTNGFFYKSGGTEPSLIGLSLSTFRDVVSLNHVKLNADGSTRIDKSGLHLNWAEKYAGLYFNKLYLGESGIAHLDTSPYTGGDTGEPQAAIRVKADNELYMFMSRKKIGNTWYGQYHFRMPYHTGTAWTDGVVFRISLGIGAKGVYIEYRDPADGKLKPLLSGMSGYDPG